MLRGSVLRQKKKFCDEKEPYLSSQTYWADRHVPLRHGDIGGFAEKLKKKALAKDEWRDSIKLAAKSFLSFCHWRYFPSL